MHHAIKLYNKNTLFSSLNGCSPFEPLATYHSHFKQSKQSKPLFEIILHFKESLPTYLRCPSFLWPPIAIHSIEFAGCTALSQSNERRLGQNYCSTRPTSSLFCFGQCTATNTSPPCSECD